MWLFLGPGAPLGVRSQCLNREILFLSAAPALQRGEPLERTHVSKASSSLTPIPVAARTHSNNEWTRGPGNPLLQSDEPSQGLIAPRLGFLMYKINEDSETKTLGL